jgi:hypothetical protein
LESGNKKCKDYSAISRTTILPLEDFLFFHGNWFEVFRMTVLTPGTAEGLNYELAMHRLLSPVVKAGQKITR